MVNETDFKDCSIPKSKFKIKNKKVLKGGREADWSKNEIGKKGPEQNN